jgi:light-regulated signal transduction histidine kinase (bacteriophytochrome)
VPIFVGDEWWGGIGFADERFGREWMEMETDALIVASGLLSAAIQRQRDDKALRQVNIKLEQRVKARTAELESFAYSVSHDLRAPLRGISGYSRLLKDDFGATLDAQATDYLDNVLKSANRMGMIIDDLLKLSHVGRAEMHREQIDFSGMVTELVDEVRKRDQNRMVDIQIQPEMKAYGDRNLLQLALSNLIDNAWKFTSPRDITHIEISAEHLAVQTIYGLKDNGVGFDMKYHDKMFMAFQRLHGQDEFEGTGIGLATVQRVIIRHGGQIWAEGAVDQGATFYFTLPDAGIGN